MRSQTSVLMFHEATKHSPESVRRRGHFLDWGNKPHPVKVHVGLERVPLPEPPSLGVPATDAIGASAAETRTPDLPALARLLVRGAGVHHSVTYPGGDVVHFRTYASAGALYPVEVYLACGELPDLPAGVYHFMPATRELARLREGDHRPWVVRAAGAEPAVVRAPAVLVLTGIPWRTAWKYTERGYRHLYWDAGMILANVLALAASAGLASRVVLGFDDAELSTLLGLDERREFPLCLVPIGAADAEMAPAGAPPAPISLETLPLSARELVFEGILEANQAGRLDRVEEVATWRARAPTERGPTEAPPGLSEDPLEAVLLRRGSARHFGPEPMPREVLSAILGRVALPIGTDYMPAGARHIRPFLVVHHVEGLEPGAYAFEDGGLQLLRAGVFREEAAYLCLEQVLGGSGVATVFLMADLRRVLGALGARGYRACQLEAGIVGGRIYLGAYAHRFGATGLTFFDDLVTEFFSPDAAGHSCMLVVALGDSPRLRRTRIAV